MSSPNLRLFLPISLVLLFATNSFSQQKQIQQYTHLAKAYSSIQYFYPNPTLLEMDWDKYLVEQVGQIQREHFNLEQAIEEVVPEVAFYKKYNSTKRLLAASSLSENLYFQHFGSVETTNGRLVEILSKSIIVGSDLRSFSMLFKFLPMSKSIGHNIKIEFDAKWKTKTEGTALVMLHAGYKENGIMKSNYNKVFIEPSNEWRHYELDTIFCSECPKRLMNALKIVRSENDTVLIDELRIIDIDNMDTLFYDGFENYDYTYNQFREYRNYILSETVRPIPNKDCTKGDFSMRLLGANLLDLYPQTKLDRFIQVSLDRDYYMEFPRFLKRGGVYDLDKIIARYNEVDFDNYKETTIYLADIIKLWTIIQHSYPYPEIKNKVDAEALLETCIAKALQPTYDATAHVHNIVCLQAAYRDPHLGIKWDYHAALKPPIIPQWIDGAYRIGLIYDEKFASYFGKEVTHVNNEAIDKWFSNRMYNKNSIKSKHLLNNSLRFLCYSVDRKSKFTFLLKDGTELIFNDSDLIDDRKAVLAPFSYLKDTIHTIANGEAMYLRIFKSGKLNKKKRTRLVRDSLSKFSWLVLDLRDKHIDRTSSSILEFKKRANRIHSKPDNNAIIDEPFKNEYEYIVLNLLDNARYEIEYFDFSPKIIVLINENTRSAPERNLLPLHDAGLITLVGQPTAGTASFVNKLTLPSGIRTSLTSGRTLYKSGVTYQDNALQPDYLVDDSLSPQDLYLQKALEIIADDKMKDD